MGSPGLGSMTTWVFQDIEYKKYKTPLIHLYSDRNQKSPFFNANSDCLKGDFGKYCQSISRLPKELVEYIVRISN